MPHHPFERKRFDVALVFKALKDEGFRARLLADPRGVYAEELEKAKPGQTIPAGVEIRMAEEAANVFYLVLPYVPPEMVLSDRRLEMVARHELTHREPCWGIGDAPDRDLGEGEG
ncbi:MAG: NHLP leader peptide family RiPP precursor [Pseudomonadota bacterium]